MADHDQRLKVAVMEFLAEFVALLCPSWRDRFRYATARWLQQEMFLDPPQGERRHIDLVARLELNQPVGQAEAALLHVEVEARDSLTDLRWRMPRYHHTLHYRHNLPVLSLGLYLSVALEGRGWDEASEELWEEKVSSTRWPYLGLPGLEALAHVEGDNLLGVALSVLMRLPEARQAWLKARALQRIALAELTAYRRFLLMELIEAYLPLVGPHLQEYERLLLTEEFTVVRVLGQTTFEKGEEQGALKGQRALLVWQLERKFGALSPSAQARLESWSVDRLKQLAEELLGNKSLVELGLEDAPNGAAPPAG